MRLVATCDVENGQNRPIFVLLQKMHGVLLSFLKQITIVTNTFVLGIFLAPHILFLWFSKQSLVHTSKYLHSTGCCRGRNGGRHIFKDYRATFQNQMFIVAFYLIYIYLLGLKNKKQAVFYVYRLHLNQCVVLCFSVLKVVKGHEMVLWRNYQC